MQKNIVLKINLVCVVYTKQTLQQFFVCLILLTIFFIENLIHIVVDRQGGYWQWADLIFTFLYAFFLSVFIFFCVYKNLSLGSNVDGHNGKKGLKKFLFFCLNGIFLSHFNFMLLHIFIIFFFAHTNKRQEGNCT